MKVSQDIWIAKTGWSTVQADATAPQFVLAIGTPEILSDQNIYNDVKAKYPDANIVWCSTRGEIHDSDISEDSLVVTAMEFEKTTLQFATTKIYNTDQSEVAGSTIAKQIPTEGLVHAMVFSDGLLVNGSRLIEGIQQELPENVSLTGGLVSDGGEFVKTLCSLNEPPETGSIVMIGFYGENVRFGYGSFGGWDPFGPRRVITKSSDNVVFEFDNKPALSLYKEYLGEKAKELPGSALLFPLRITLPNGDEVVRTILGCSEADQSLNFAGNVPEGVQGELMKANFERVIDGAYNAATMSIEKLGEHKPDVAILISCIGRKLVLQEKVIEEIEAVSEALGGDIITTGFYSNGEICPTAATSKQCQLHNQTMTITTIREL